MSGILYVVATPIGNLEDITYRAVRILGEVNWIACEDTRQTRKLLDHYHIRTPRISYHEHNEMERAKELCSRLLAGESGALVSDAGVPLISDPGYRLVHSAVGAGMVVQPVPGPSAVLAALSASGLPTDAFHFAGFLPQKPGQRVHALEALKDEHATLIFYESPQRIVESLADIRGRDAAIATSWWLARSPRSTKSSCMARPPNCAPNWRRGSAEGRDYAARRQGHPAGG